MIQINYIIHCPATKAGHDFHARNIDKIINRTIKLLTLEI